jgi:hypothetical protein
MAKSACEEVIKSSAFSEETKKNLFEVVMTDYEDMTEEQKNYFKVAGYTALQNGMEVLNTLMLHSKEN